MNGQEIGVAVIVLGAVAFLVRRLWGRAPEKPNTVTFVPIDDLKTRRKRPGEHCQ